MADKKISELVSITGSATAADDYFVVVDTSGAVTHKISREELNNAIEQDVLENIKFGDNDKANFGDDNDLQVFHDGTHSRIADVGTGDLKIGTSGGAVRITANGVADDMVVANQGGSVSLSYSGNTKIATSSSGVDVTGDITAENLDLESASGGRVTFTDTGTQSYSIGNSGNSFTIYDETDNREALSIDGGGSVTIETDNNSTQLTLSSTDTDATEGPRLDLRRNSSSPADNDAIGTIRFLAQDSAAANTVFAEIQTLVQDVTAGTTDANMQLLVRRNGTLTEGLSLSSTDTVFNESGNDIDFRIESSLQSNAFFVNGGNSYAGINKAPSFEFDVTAADNGGCDMRILAGTDAGADAQLRIQCQATSGDRRSKILFGDTANTAIGRIEYHHDDDHMEFYTNGAERLRLSSAGLSFDDGSNYLNSYEQGIWTPSFVSTGTQPTISYSVQSGNYTKIGRLVTVNFGTNTSSVSGGSGELRISGLPFSVASGNYAGSRAGNMQNWNTSVDASIGGFVSGTQIVLAKNNNVRITVSDLRTSNDSNQLWWTLSYPTNA